ncbi:unnamed protein product [Cylicocyclus nassatus]|uniref:Uncharacterized protein n=1 Tax=Cylicocyclus nassatus TaxID=53992 RepID=A0AA36H7A4_CYLNA|nr:unnamed protein product [Cylicocyclus nassatus]
MAQSIVLVMMMLIALVLAYWYYLEKSRKAQEPKKYDLPVDKIALHSVKETEKTECVPKTDKTQASINEVTEAENISEGRGIEILKVDPAKRVKTSGMDSAESIENLDPQIAQKYAFLRKPGGKTVDLEAFDEPITEKEMAIYKTPNSIRENVERPKKKKKKDASSKKVKAAKSDKSAKNRSRSGRSSKKSSRSNKSNSKRRGKGPFKNKRRKFAKNSGDLEDSTGTSGTSLF